MIDLSQLVDMDSAKLSTMTDERVLALTELSLSDEDDEQLSDLLERQQAGHLTNDERVELARLMQRYQEGLLLKSEALAEAVRRKLMPPLAS